MTKCVINNCTELITCLETAKKGEPGNEFIELSAALFNAAGELAAALLVPSLTVTQLDAETPLIQPGTQSGDPCVWIVGKTVLFPSGPEPKIQYSVRISADVIGPEVVRLLLDGTPLAPSEWAFAKNFAPFPDYYGYENPGLGWLPSFYNGIVITQPHFRVATAAQGVYPQGLSFEGVVDLTQGSLTSIGGLFPGANHVATRGPVVLRADTYPVLNLTGDLPGYSINQLAGLSLNFGTQDAGPNPEKEPAASTLLLVGTTQIGSFPTIRLSAPVLQGNFLWDITGEIENKEQYSLAAGLQALISYVNNHNLPLLVGLDTPGFYLDSVTVSITPSLSPVIHSIGFRVASVPSKSWSAPILGLGISGNMYLQWQVISPFGPTPQLVGMVGGTLNLGSGSAVSRIHLQVLLPDINSSTAPDVEIIGQLDPESPVPLDALFKQFTGIQLDLDLVIAAILFEASTGPRILQFQVQLKGTWPFSVPLIVFGETMFFFRYSPNGITGSASMRVSIVTFEFFVSAEYATGANWQFSGQLLPDSQNRKLQDFVNEITGNQYPSLPANLGEITLQRFEVSFNTGTGAFSFEGALTWPFIYDDLPQVTIDAALSLQSTSPSSDGSRQYSGYVSGKLSVNAFSVGVIYNFGVVNNTTITFVIKYKGVTFTCVYSRDPKTGDSILKANLGGVTFGDIVEYLVNLVNPNLGFSLSAPWDVLNQIKFDNLTLTVNLTKKTVGISYKLGQNLGIADIDTISLTYVNKAGKTTVQISITGRFVDQTYTDAEPLSWDLLNEPAPTPSGQGDQLLDLRYLGLGQNVGFRDARAFPDVQSVIKALEADFVPTGSDDQNPLLLPILNTLKFTGNGHWLIGADFTVIGAVSISVVFNDPTLYGVRIALKGDKVKSFSGLDFQILYKKITDTIGVYHIELTLPEAFRQLQFGVVSVTIPTVVIDIYTNGNFRIDMGFPVGLDFSKSFCVQAGPFIGYGGFYFAVLNGATSERVPKITNGNFSPVIEAGLAVNVGLGRTFNKGILSAGVTVTMVAVVEGVFAWFNPNDTSVGSAQYYLIQGTAAIVGKLYGKVDFGIIQANVNVTAQAQVTLTIEAYKAIQIGLSIAVRVSVSVKIAFFRISFSFSMTLDLSFTIGSASTPPWQLETAQPPPLMLRQQAGMYSRRKLSGARLQRVLLAALNEDGTFNWTPRAVFPAVQAVELSMLPALTVALPSAVFATHSLTAEATGPVGESQYQIVMSLFAENSVSPEARTAKEVRLLKSSNIGASPFDLLVSGMFKWALSSYTRPPGVALPPPSQYTLPSDLEAISDFLADPSNWQSVFTYDALAALMELNYILQIRTPMGPSGSVHPNGLLNADDTAPEVSATIFPMIPDLAMGPAGLPVVQFWNYNCISAAYEEALAAYYRQLQVNTNSTGSSEEVSPANDQPTNFRVEPGPQGCPAGTESLSTFVFRDYFAMLTKGAVNAAIDLLKSYPYEPTGSTGLSGPPESLQSIADQFNGVDVEYRARAGDTLGRIAGRHGISLQQLKSSNPHLLGHRHDDSLAAGTVVTVNTGVTPESIVAANPDYPLQYKTQSGLPIIMTITGAQHQVLAGPSGGTETLKSISAQYGLSGPTGPASIFTYERPTGNPNANNTSLLQPGAQIEIPAQTFTVASPIDNSKDLVSAFFFVRSIGPPQPGQTPWYSYTQFYEQWMLDNPGPVGATVWPIPIAELQGENLVVSKTGQYAPQGAEGSALAPDTRALAAGYCAMSQLNPEPFTKSFENFKTFVSPTGPPQTYEIDQFPYTVQPGDTVNGVAQLFGVSVNDLIALNEGATGMLQPLAVLDLPTLDHPIGSGDTFSNVAANYDFTLDQLAESVRNNNGILTPYSPDAEPLTIPELPGRGTDQLIADLAHFGRFNDVSGMVTRFLLHGLRVPAPGSESGPVFPPDTPLWGLYEMTGQQFPAPPTGPSGGFPVEFTKGATANWVCLVPSPTGPPDCEDKLTVYVTPEFFKDSPSRILEPDLLAGPTGLPLYRDTQRQYSISENIHWQATTTPTLPDTGATPPVAGQPSIWNFPQTLLRVAMQGPIGPTSTPQYELAVTNPNDPSGASDRPVGIYSWAGTVDVRIQRAPSASSGQFMPNSYLVLGADQSGRERLLSAWTYLQNVTKPSQLYILYSPSATNNNTNGLASDRLDPMQTFVLKTNLTTVTTSNPSAALVGAMPMPSGEYYARLEAVTDFLRLIWEASVTGSGGFYLNYVNANGGAGLPETLFANGDTATITLLLLSALQAEIPPYDRGLYPFNNCAVVGDNIDPSSMQLYVRPRDLDLVRVATVPAGLAGFYLARKNPESSTPGPLPPEAQTRNLYNLTGYKITENNYFTESNQGLPAGPEETPVAGVSGPTGPGVWWYQQVLPVYKFGKVNDTPASPALPPIAENPYAGITGPTGAVGLLSDVTMDLGFNDVYGNETVTTGATLNVKTPFGYIDELIGISSWPAAGADYTFVPGPASEVRLETRLSMQLDKYSPTDGYSFEQANAAAIADAQRYAQIFYQVQQHDLAFELRTNLGHTLIKADALKANLAAFVSKAKVFADACAAQPQQQYTTAANDQVKAIADAYSVTPGMLVSQNQDVPVAQLFPGKIVQPFFVVAGPMNTLRRLVAGYTATPYPPQCSGSTGMPDCTGSNTTTETEGELQPAELLSHNQTTPLTPGIVLRTQPRTGVLPSDIPNTLADAAAALQCVVYGLARNPDNETAGIEIGLFIDNLTIHGVVAPHHLIEIDGKVVDTGPDPTLRSVEIEFSSLGLNRGDFVVKLQTVKGIFVPAANLTLADFIVPQPPPAQIGPAVPIFNINGLPNGSGTLEFLANQNAVVENFFYAGAALYMSACCYQPQSFDTFASLATQFNITFEQLAEFNSNAPLKADVSLAIPNLTYVNDPSSVYAPYSPRLSDSLASIAGTFKSTTGVIAEINRYLPGIFADGVTITIGTTTFTTEPLDSLQSASAAFPDTFDQFITAIKDKTNLYRLNGTVLTPLPVVPDGGTGESPTLTQFVAQFNLQSGDSNEAATSLLTTNRSLERFLRAGARIAAPVLTEPITVGPHDTVNTIINRFARERNLQVTVTELAVANAATPGLFTVNQPFVLPPNVTTTTSDVTPTIPPENSGGEAEIVFPVSVSVAMRRPLHLVSPDFQDTAAVFANTSAFSPRGLAQGASSVNLNAFARNFEAAFERHRLKCAVVQKDALSSPQAPQLFAVNFGEKGVRRFIVDEKVPQFYSMAPLSTKLLSGTLPIRKYISGCGLGPVEYKTFDSIDLDSWMGQFLSAVDLFLTANYSVPAFQLDSSGSATVAQTGPVGFAGISLESRLPEVTVGPTGCTGGTGAFGPANYDSIVAAKYGIAQQLSAEVVPVLQNIGPTADYYSDAAQETLYQQMLVRLTDAYSVNAVVQYPVDLESPCVTPRDAQGSTGPLPPRVSGQIIPDLFAAPVDPGGEALPPVPLQNLLAHFNVSLPFIAETIGGVQGILEDGVTVAYNEQTYKIKQNDMLNLVAQNLGVATDPSAPGYWETWTQFITGIAAQPLLVAGWTLSVVQIERMVYQGDSIETIAEFFGTDAATVGEANQSKIGIFIQKELNLEGYLPYLIKPGDTLATIAPAIVPLDNNPPLTVGTLAQAVSGMEPLLQVGEILYLTQVLPDITLSTAKVSLGRVGDQHGLAPPLSFLFSLKHARQYRKLFLSLKYVINEMEFGIRNVPKTDGYQSSSWLTFVLPIGSGEGADVGVKTEMSQVQIPIPLRAYPVPPTLVAQSGLASAATSPPVTPEEAIAQGRSWDYRIDFQSTNAAQDSNHVQVSFNSFTGASGPQPLSLSPKRTQLVFGALAEFIDASASLSTDLALLLRQPNQTAAIAVSVLDTFATSVAKALGYSDALELLGAQWPTLTYLYKLQTTTANRELKELTLTYELGPSGATGPLWPDVLIRSLTAPTGGTGADAGFIPLTPAGTPTGLTANFTYPPDFPADVPITQRFLFEERDVIRNQNGSGGIYLTRNDNLIASGPLGAVSPTGPTAPPRPVDTSEAFLYQTPLVSFINPLTPFLSDSTSIDVANLRGPSGSAQPPRTLAQHIENMLDAVLELGPTSPVKADSEISILCSYAFPVGGAGGEIVATTPIRLVPAQLMTASTKTAFANQLSKSILSWPGWPGYGGPGELIFGLNVFTTAGGDTSESSLRPILEFEVLRVPLSQIVPPAIGE